MFQATAAFALGLIALGIGFWVLLKTRNDEAGKLKGFGSFIGYFIIVIAFFTILCTGYYTVRYWEDGYYNKPRLAQMTMMPGGGMMMGQMPGRTHGNMMGEMGRHSAQCQMMMSHKKSCPNCGQMMKGGMMHGGMMKGEMMKGGMMHGEKESPHEEKGEMMKNMDQSKHHPGDKDK